MRVRKIVALAALTLCVGGAVADIVVITASSTPTPLTAVADVFRAQVSDRGGIDQAWSRVQPPEIDATITYPARTVPADQPADIAAYADALARPHNDRDLSDTATGTAVGLVAGILVGGLVGVIFGTATGVVLMLCAGTGVAATPLVSQAFGSGVLGDCVTGGLVGLTVGGIIGLLGVAAPAAVSGAVGYFAKNGRRR